MVKSGITSVGPGEVIVTSPGNLARTHKVKKILHVASVIGQLGKGYFPIPDVPGCVENALRTVDEKLANDDITSILFPLMGKGVAHRSFEQGVEALLEVAIDYLNSNPLSVLEKVFFLNYSDKELEVCQRLLDMNPKLSAAQEPQPLAPSDLKPAPVAGQKAQDVPGTPAPQAEAARSMGA